MGHYFLDIQYKKGGIMKYHQRKRFLGESYDNSIHSLPKQRDYKKKYFLLLISIKKNTLRSLPTLS